VRHKQVVRIAAVAVNAERARRHAELLFVLLADFAFAAADPWEDQTAIAKLHAHGLRPERDDLADVLVTHV
jgi:hypothetical protein